MEPEDYVMRVAYFVLFITLALMSWAVTVQAQLQTSPLVSRSTRLNQGSVSSVEDHSPCSFNMLCTCSKPGPSEFGIVCCGNSVPFANIPLTLNYSRAFMLSMDGNNLQVLEEKRLVASGLWRLEIRNNELYRIADDAFFGLSKFLTELDLQHNALTSVPTVAVGSLTKLRELNLNGNRITDINRDDLERFPRSITYLRLASNMITNIPENVFSSLSKLECLDLSFNSIQFVHPQAFFGVSKYLRELYLSHNLLQKIPFEALTNLNLNDLDLTHNLISSTSDTFYQGKLSVHNLLLDHNRIEYIRSHCFHNFGQVSIVSLTHNPIFFIPDDAFRDTLIADLDLSNCYIEDISSHAFRGLETSLTRLSLNSNNLTYLPLPDLFGNFDHLISLSLDENKVMVSPEEFFEFSSSIQLQRFSLLGDSISPIPTEALRSIRNLRELNMSNMGLSSLTPNVFEGFSLSVDKLKIAFGKVSSIMNSAFVHLKGLKSVDLSNNKIVWIEDHAFGQVGHTITSLKLSNSLRMNTLQAVVLHPLTNLKELDLSSNWLSSLNSNTFEKSSQLTHLSLRWNRLTSIPSNLFDARKTPKLQRLLLSFNSIKEIKEATFSKLKELSYLELNENLIEFIGKRSFEDLTSLKVLNLAGNKLEFLVDEAFQNLPRLQLLDLSYNDLRSLNINAFEQLGTLSSFRIDLSHNKILRLGFSRQLKNQNLDLLQSSPAKFKPLPSEIYEDSAEFSDESDTFEWSVHSISSSSVESVDLSHNNISYIAPNYFGPISSTLIDLDLSYNKLSNLTRGHLAGMRFIQSLKLDSNLVNTVEYDAFKESKLIQVISLNQNLVRDLPPDLFEDCRNLRVFSVSGNKIRSLADSLFKDSPLEILNMAGNQLIRFPEAALSKIASTLVRLDLSGNEISSLASNQIEPLEQLRWLNLANNRITAVADTTFGHGSSILHIDFSGNPMRRISSRLFEGTRHTLLHLHLSNMSLEVLPDFDTFPKLLTFNVSFNSLTLLPTNFGVNVSNLRTLDISGNEIHTPPNTIWHTIPRLSTLIMHSNPIEGLSNDSFLQLERLHYLDVSYLPLEYIQGGALLPMVCLKHLKMGPLQDPTNPGILIQSLISLEHLHFQTPNISIELRSFPVPQKLSKITISGLPLQSIAEGTFQGIRSRSLHLVIEDTGITNIGEGVLQYLGEATDLTLEIRGNNSLLKSIGNPNAEYRPEPFVPYLKDLVLDLPLSIACTCDAGWIEFWLRQWMQRTCPLELDSTARQLECDMYLKSLRNVGCKDRLGVGLLDAFVTELECGWDSSASALKTSDLRFNVVIVISTVLYGYNLMD